MGNFGNKWNKFVQIFIEKNGYVKAFFSRCCGASR